jgi:hypothetical protein
MLATGTIFEFLEHEIRLYILSSLVLNYTQDMFLFNLIH